LNPLARKKTTISGNTAARFLNDAERSHLRELTVSVRGTHLLVELSFPKIGPVDLHFHSGEAARLSLVTH
jgi:hypothetical protein